MANHTEDISGRIVTDPRILLGKATVKGTRISVELVLEHLAGNPDLADLFAAYPELTVADVKAVLTCRQRSAGSLKSSPSTVAT